MDVATLVALFRAEVNDSFYRIFVVGYRSLRVLLTTRRRCFAA